MWAGPALGAAKEAVYQIVMGQPDARYWPARFPLVIKRVDQAARSLLWPTLTSPEALFRQGRIERL